MSAKDSKSTPTPRKRRRIIIEEQETPKGPYFSKPEHVTRFVGKLVRDKVKCGVCGAKMKSVKRGDQYYYACHYAVTPKKQLNVLERERRCNMPYVNAAILDRYVEDELLARFFMFPKKTLRDWGEKEVSNYRLGQLRKKVRDIDRRLKDLEGQQQRLLQAFVKGMFTEDQVEIEKERLTLQQEMAKEAKRGAERELNEAIARLDHIKLVQDHGEDLKALGKKLSGKIRELPLTQKRILVSYFIPPACFVRVWPSDEPRRVKVNKFKRVQKWDYRLVSKTNVKALLEVLRNLEVSGEVTETYRDFGSLKEGIRK